MQKPFNITLAEIRNGMLLQEMSDQFQELVRAVDETRKTGKFVLELTVTPTKSSSAVDVADNVKVKIPQLPKGSSLFFVSVEGNLTQNNPFQPDLTGLRTVEEKPRGEVKQA